MLTILALAACAVLAAWGWRSRELTAAVEQRLARATRDLESLEHAFTRFAPHEIVERIITDGIATRADTKDVTILFTDLQGFTSLAETLEPEALVALLNVYFERMGRAIAAHRGHLAKFLGDGLLALFGALEPNPWQTNDALHAALAMREALATLNAELRAARRPELAMGIGIHRGTVVAGVLGTSEVKEYGVIGRAVNVASRVEDLTRVHRTDVLVTDAVRARCDPRFRLRTLPPVEVKGLPDPIATFALDGFDAG